MTVTQSTNGNNFITWKRVALSSFALIGLLVTFGGNAMVAIANNHVTKQEAPALIESTMKPLSDQVYVNGNRITKIETQYEAIQKELAEIKDLLRKSH